MIELNLIDAVSRSSPASATIRIDPLADFAGRPAKKHKPLIVVGIMAGIVIALYVFLCFAGVPRPLQGVLPSPILSALGICDPSRSGPSLDRGVAQTTSAGGTIQTSRAAAEAAALRKVQESSVIAEKVVQDVQPSMFRPEKRSDYASFLPLEKILYQKAMAAQILAFINAVTPEGVSFADVVYSAPNYYYIRGVADSPVSQRNYLERLRLGSANFKTPQLPENAPATDVTAYGVLSAKEDLGKAKDIPFVKDSEISQELGALRGLDAGGRLKLAGLERPIVEDFGVYKSYTYKVTTHADYQVVLHFVESLANSPVRIGIEKIQMSAAGKSGISTFMTLVLYASH